LRLLRRACRLAVAVARGHRDNAPPNCRGVPWGKVNYFSAMVSLIICTLSGRRVRSCGVIVFIAQEQLDAVLSNGDFCD
jgi:hypothetical protein